MIDALIADVGPYGERRLRNNLAISRKFELNFGRITIGQECHALGDFESGCGIMQGKVDAL